MVTLDVDADAPGGRARGGPGSCSTRSSTATRSPRWSWSPATTAARTRCIAIRRGAVDWYAKPIELDELRVILRRALHVRGDRAARRRRGASAGRKRYHRLVGESEAIRKVFALVQRVAPTDATVLITGRERHRQGAGRARDPRGRARGASGPFVPDQLRRHPRARCSRASCSATSAARSPTPTARARASSSWPTAARCSSTRSASCRRHLQVKLLRFLQDQRGRARRRARAAQGGRARRGRHQPRPARRRSRRGASARTSSTG